jgi:hypothetical protein
MTNATNWYAIEFKNWVKQCGSKPSAEMLQSIHDLGLRPGKQAIACAMGLRPEGVTNSQIALVCGNPQLNRMRGLIDDRLVKRLPASRDERNHTVYKLQLTEKGMARIASAQKRAAENEVAGGVEPAIAAKRAASGAKPVKGKATKAKPAKATRKPAKAAGELSGPALAIDDNGNTVAISPSVELLPANVLIENETDGFDNPPVAETE